MPFVVISIWLYVEHCRVFVCMYVYDASSAGSGYSKTDGCTFGVCGLLSTIAMLPRTLRHVSKPFEGYHG